ncbi:hypothetical protein PG985_015775 [Apiospora marii]|uniref:uncharacterized protein n=1 Tax=Apiospora marii TaxID=335849 RepID=UPI00312E0135
MNIRAATVTARADAVSNTSPGPTPQTTPPPPPLRVMMLESASESFALGIDTCGFTSESTLTCSAGYCTNIGDHRGCCTGSPADCSASIWTTCRGYTEGAGGYCGAHTLCCSAESLPACVTYYFTTHDEPGETFTNVGCGTSAMYGQMYPFPPELMPTTSAEANPSATAVTVSPVNSTPSDPDGKTPSTSPTGAIVGAIVGGVLLVALAVLAFVLLAKRRRRQREQQQQQQQIITKDLISAPSPTSHEKSGGLRTRLRLSTIPEQPASPMLSRYKSARRSYGPDWPLGSADPLESHPVLPLVTPAPVPADSAVDLERRLSEPRGVTGTNQIPQLQIPAVPETRLAPAPPPKSPIGGGSVSPSQQQLQEQQKQPPSPKGLLQSPRLSFAPPASPIDAAFNAEVDRRVSGIDGAASAAPSAASALTPPCRRRKYNIRVSTKPPPRNSTYQDGGAVSPIEDSPVAENPKRLSLVSAPSHRGSRFIEAADDLVSPVSPEDDEEGKLGGEGKGGGDSGRVSPATVSPLESRRPSLEQ